MQRKPNFKFCAADLETFLILPLQFTERGIHTNPEPPLVQDNDFHEKNCRNSITVFSILQCKKSRVKKITSSFSMQTSKKYFVQNF